MDDDLISLKQTFLIVLDYLEAMDGVAESERLGDPRPFLGIKRRVTNELTPSGPEYIARFTPRPQPRIDIRTGTRLPHKVCLPCVPRVPDRDQLGAMLNDYAKSRKEMTSAEVRICRAHEIISSFILNKSSHIFGELYVEFEHISHLSKEDVECLEDDEKFMPVGISQYKIIKSNDMTIDYQECEIIHSEKREFDYMGGVFTGFIYLIKAKLILGEVKLFLDDVSQSPKFDFGIEEDARDGSWSIRWKGDAYRLPAQTTTPQKRGLRAISLMAKFRGCDIAVALLCLTEWIDRNSRPRGNNYGERKETRQKVEKILRDMIDYVIVDESKTQIYVNKINENVLSIVTGRAIKLDSTDKNLSKSATIGPDDLRTIRESIEGVIVLLNDKGNIFSEIAKFIGSTVTAERWYARMSFDV